MLRIASVVKQDGGWSEDPSTLTCPPNDVVDAVLADAETISFQACRGVWCGIGIKAVTSDGKWRSVFLEVGSVRGGTRSPLIRPSGRFSPWGGEGPDAGWCVARGRFLPGGIQRWFGDSRAWNGGSRSGNTPVWRGWSDPGNATYPEVRWRDASVVRWVCRSARDSVGSRPIERMSRRLPDRGIWSGNRSVRMM